ncbi:uncharacterized protein N7503_006546 [Penicillium pulvis]|uniref:uncharacterized protein n=1 Tax=Penicillium pulvis TaxID=1562058 RepID=UPI0025493CDB|nr:uncharacterized protein N7503_006546 [Penicillium pulvis]KAJ5799041.1 hypothetical protein N7503_006546 [Penicillium pulvis]
MMLKGKRQQAAPRDEVTQYLDSDIAEVAPLAFWRENQYRFPALANLARDVLSVPASGAGVERLFNTARDICHYRRGRLNATTIQELMMFLCTSRFDMQEEQFKFLKEFYSSDEIEAANEEREMIHQISFILIQSVTMRKSIHKGKRRLKGLNHLKTMISLICL